MVDSEFLSTLRRQIQSEGLISMNIVGASMLPLITDNSKVVVRKILTDEKLKKFDIIVFGQGGKLICHYFWKSNQHFISSEGGGIVITRPLNPIIGFDHPITYNEVIGKVVNYKIPQKTRFKIYIRTIFKNYLNKA